jgi:hypothetical protein
MAAGEEPDPLLFPWYIDGHPCFRCGTVDLAVGDPKALWRVTHLDVPDSWRAELHEPGSDTQLGEGRELKVAICDSCGEASPRVDPS